MTIDTRAWLCGPPPAKGQRQRFPGRFLYNLKKFYPPDANTLWMFSGSLGTEVPGDKVDLHTTDGKNLAGHFLLWPKQTRKRYTMVVADPPYTTGFAQEWTELPKEIPKPKDVLRVATRMCKKGGLILVLHILVLPAYKELHIERIALHPVFCGPNNSIRVLNVFRKVE